AQEVGRQVERREHDALGVVRGGEAADRALEQIHGALVLEVRLAVAEREQETGIVWGAREERFEAADAILESPGVPRDLVVAGRRLHRRRLRRHERVARRERIVAGAR